MNPAQEVSGAEETPLKLPPWRALVLSALGWRRRCHIAAARKGTSVTIQESFTLMRSNATYGVIELGTERLGVGHQWVHSS